MPASLNPSGLVADPATFLCLNAPAVGDGEQNRDGKIIGMKTLQIAGVLTVPSQTALTAVSQPIVIELMLVMDMQTNSTQTDSNTILVNPPAQAGNVNTLRNLLFSSRYRVLKRKQFILRYGAVGSVGATFAQGGGYNTFDWFIDLKSTLVHFNGGTTGAVSNIADNSLHMVAYASATGASLSYSSRMKFIG